MPYYAYTVLTIPYYAYYAILCLLFHTTLYHTMLTIPHYAYYFILCLLCLLYHTMPSIHYYASYAYSAYLEQLHCEVFYITMSLKAFFIDGT